MWQMLKVLVHRYCHYLFVSKLTVPSCGPATPCQPQLLFLQPALGGASAPAADKAKPAAVNITATPTIPASSDKPRAPAQSSNTRARRLSYVTNDVSASYHNFSVFSLYTSVQRVTFLGLGRCLARDPLEPTPTLHCAWLLAWPVLHN